MKEFFNQNIENIKTSDILELGQYENCQFIKSDFSEATLKEMVFMESSFKDCNLSSAKISMSSWKQVSFDSCKMIGLSFENCNSFLFEINCNNCQLDLSSFHGMVLRNMKFTNTSFIEVDFTDTDLSGVIFENCDFKNAQFDNTNLEETDFRTSYNFHINPSQNRLSKTKFSRNNVEGLLHSLDITID